MQGSDGEIRRAIANARAHVHHTTAHESHDGCHQIALSAIVTTIMGCSSGTSKRQIVPVARQCVTGMSPSADCHLLRALRKKWNVTSHRQTIPMERRCANRKAHIAGGAGSAPTIQCRVPYCIDCMLQRDCHRGPIRRASAGSGDRALRHWRRLCLADCAVPAAAEVFGNRSTSHRCGYRDEGVSRASWHLRPVSKSFAARSAHLQCADAATVARLVAPDQTS